MSEHYDDCWYKARGGVRYDDEQKCDCVERQLRADLARLRGERDAAGKVMEQMNNTMDEDRAAIRDADALNYGEAAYREWREKHAPAIARAQGEGK